MFEHNETLEQARERNIHDALAEDIGRGDWTALLVPATQRVRARVIVREAAVLCGRDWFDGCLHALDPAARVAWAADEGARVTAGATLCEIEAKARALAELVLSDGDAPRGAGRLAVESLLEVADPAVSSAARRALDTLADVRGDGRGGGIEERELREFSTRALEAINAPELDADGAIEVVGED